METVRKRTPPSLEAQRRLPGVRRKDRRSFIHGNFYIITRLEIDNILLDLSAIIIIRIWVVYINPYIPAIFMIDTCAMNRRRRTPGGILRRNRE